MRCQCVALYLENVADRDRVLSADSARSPAAVLIVCRSVVRHMPGRSPAVRTQGHDTNTIPDTQDGERATMPAKCRPTAVVDSDMVGRRVLCMSDKHALRPPSFDNGTIAFVIA